MVGKSAHYLSNNCSKTRSAGGGATFSWVPSLDTPEGVGKYSHLNRPARKSHLLIRIGHRSQPPCNADRDPSDDRTTDG